MTKPIVNIVDVQLQPWPAMGGLNHLVSLESYYRRCFPFFLVFVLLFCSFRPVDAQVASGDQTKQKTMTQMEFTNLGMKAYEDRNPSLALRYLRQGVEAYPDNPLSYLNLASMDYQIAIELKRQGANPDVWLALGREAEQGFRITIQMKNNFPKDFTQTGVNNIIGHAAFLLGDMYHYLYDQPRKARDYFEFAKKYFPESQNLKRELNVVTEKIGADYQPQPVDLK